MSVLGQELGMAAGQEQGFVQVQELGKDKRLGHRFCQVQGWDTVRGRG
jgi:hypothetical protein